MKGAMKAWAWRIGAGLSLLTALAFSASAGKPPKPPPPSTPQKIVFGRPNCLFTMNTDGTEQAVIPGCSETVQDRFPVWSPDGEKIAYRSCASGIDETWVMNRDGTNRTQLTNFGVANGYATPSAYSRDGMFIPVSYQIGNISYSLHEVYLFPAEGGAPVLVATATGPAKVGAARQPWSPDLDPATPGYQGKFLLHHMSPNYAVSVVDISIVDGVASVGLEAPVAIMTGWGTLAWSPDGKRVSYGSMLVADVTGYDPDTGAPLLGPAYPLMEEACGQSIYPSWSPDSTQVVFGSTCLTGRWEIYKVTVPAVLFDPETGQPAPAPTPVNLTNNRRAADYEPSWSPTLTP